MNDLTPKVIVLIKKHYTTDSILLIRCEASAKDNFA
jgi:hypothetical protein